MLQHKFMLNTLMARMPWPKAQLNERMIDPICRMDFD